MLTFFKKHPRKLGNVRVWECQNVGGEKFANLGEICANLGEKFANLGEICANLGEKFAN